MNCTLLVIDSETKTKEEIEKFFGNGLYTLNEVTHYKLESTPLVTESFNALPSVADSDTTVQSKKVTAFTKFMEKYDPNVTEYSARSYLLTPTKKVSQNSSSFHHVLESPELKAPLYWNSSLGGWISSVRNKGAFDDYFWMGESQEEVEELELSGFTFSKYKRGLLLKSEKELEDVQKYFHGGYWNQSLDGWVFKTSFRQKLLDLGASEM